MGALVYTAFSGSHQDAIKKGFEALETSDSPFFEVPYIPIDPKDVGRSYEDVVRVNSQSGKGGVSYLLKTEHSLDLPRRMQIEFTRVIQGITDRTGKELTASNIFDEFEGTYLGLDAPYLLQGFESAQNAKGEDKTLLTARMSEDGEARVVQGSGNGSLSAFVSGFSELVGSDLRVLDYQEHSKGSTKDAVAVTYIEMEIDGVELWGCGMHTDITTSSLRAVVSAVNRSRRS